MGWAYGTAHDGREIGYSVEATCDEPDCDKQIDRGLAYLCGDLATVLDNDPDAAGCGRYFCGDHLFMPRTPLADGTGLCDRCWDEQDDEHD